MMRVLYIGQKPETVDYTDPAVPPGMSAEKINAGIALSLDQMKERGWEVDLFLISPDKSAGPMLTAQLKTTAYDCVVIGGGIRLPPKSLQLFEIVINTIHKAAPDTAIAFNTTPQDTADAVARWIQPKTSD
jgi:hypothetical protein